MNIGCSNIETEVDIERCNNYCVIQKSCGALKEAKRLSKNKEEKIKTKVPLQPSIPPMPPVKPPKKEKLKRLYEDDDFIIDLFPEEPMVRVSIFKDNHFQDEVIIRKDDYCG